MNQQSLTQPIVVKLQIHRLNDYVKLVHFYRLANTPLRLGGKKGYQDTLHKLQTNHDNPHHLKPSEMPKSLTPSPKEVGTHRRPELVPPLT